MSVGITIRWYNKIHGRAEQPCPQCGSYDVHMSVTPTGDHGPRGQKLWDANGQCENNHLRIRFHNLTVERVSHRKDGGTKAPAE